MHMYLSVLTEALLNMCMLYPRQAAMDIDASAPVCRICLRQRSNACSRQHRQDLTSRVLKPGDSILIRPRSALTRSSSLLQSVHCVTRKASIQDGDEAHIQRQRNLRRLSLWPGVSLLTCTKKMSALDCQ